MGFEPIGGRVLCVRESEKSTTAGGLVIPETARERLDRGRVVAVADDVLEVEVGDVVVWGRYSDQTIAAAGLAGDGLEAVILEEADIFGKIVE